MKTFLSTALLLASLALRVGAANYKISDLPIITSPSTNTFIEVADMNQVTKSRKYLLTNLVTQAQLAASGDLWTNSAGVLQPANLALQPLVNTGWFIGTNAPAYWGGNLTLGESLVAARIVSEGDPDFNQFMFTVSDDLLASNYAMFGGYMSTNQINLSEAIIDANGTSGWLTLVTSSGGYSVSKTALVAGNTVANFDPTVADGAGNTAWSFDTFTPLTLGNAAEFKVSGTTVAKIAAASGYTGAGTKFLSDDGTYKAAGGGDTIWTNNAGLIEPLGGQATNVLRFTSGLADNATNVALVVDTAEAWTDGSLMDLHSGGVKALQITPSGGLVLGIGSVTNWGGLPDNSYILFSYMDSSIGAGSSEVYASRFNGAASSDFSLFASSVEARLTVRGIATADGFTMVKTSAEEHNPRITGVNGITGAPFQVDVFDLRPGASASTTPYFFDTISYHTSGNLAAVKNLSTNKFTVTYDGRITLSGQTNLVGDNGTALTYNGVPVGGSGGGNMTNSGASVVGMLPVYTDTSGTQVTPTNALTALDVGTLTLPNLSASRALVTDASTNVTVSATTATELGYVSGVTSAIQTQLNAKAPLAPTSWTQVTPDGTNAVINLSGVVAGVDKNFYYSLSTSNYIIFSNIVAGAQGTIWVNASGTPQGINFLSTYDNFSTNDIAPVFTITNRAIIAYKVGWGTDATNVMLAIKRK